jgi:hypothetical protein
VRGSRSVLNTKIFSYPAIVPGQFPTITTLSLTSFDLVATQQFKMGFTDLLTDAGATGRLSRTIRASKFR